VKEVTYAVVELNIHTKTLFYAWVILMKIIKGAKLSMGAGFKIYGSL
jgi:hypothetical protein